MVGTPQGLGSSVITHFCFFLLFCSVSRAEYKLNRRNDSVWQPLVEYGFSERMLSRRIWFSTNWGTMGNWCGGGGALNAYPGVGVGGLGRRGGCATCELELGNYCGRGLLYMRIRGLEYASFAEAIRSPKTRSKC